MVRSQQRYPEPVPVPVPVPDPVPAPPIPVPVPVPPVPTGNFTDNSTAIKALSRALFPSVKRVNRNTVLSRALTSRLLSYRTTSTKNDFSFVESNESFVFCGFPVLVPVPVPDPVPAPPIPVPVPVPPVPTGNFTDNSTAIKALSRALFPSVKRVNRNTVLSRALTSRLLSYRTTSTKNDFSFVESNESFVFCGFELTRLCCCCLLTA